MNDQIHCKIRNISFSGLFRNFGGHFEMTDILNLSVANSDHTNGQKTRKFLLCLDFGLGLRRHFENSRHFKIYIAINELSDVKKHKIHVLPGQIH